MTELLTAAQMQAIEQAAIRSGEVTGLELMERAGQGVVEAIFEEWPELAQPVESGRGASPSRSPEYLGKDDAPRRAVVLCGPGNNGGDGFVVARLLKERGWAVEVFLYGEPEKLPPDAKVNYERWQAIGRVAEWDGRRIGEAVADLFVDALFGAGLKRAPSREILEPLTKLYTEGKTFGRMVAIDAPTGLCMDSGRVLCSEFGAVWSWLTVTFHSPRIGHFIDEGPSYCGAVRTVDIGLGGHDWGEAARKALADFHRLEKGRGMGRVVATLMSPELVSSYLGKETEEHKYTYGHALLLSGGHGKTGAARLAARGALRIGAGLVTVGSPRSAMMENACQLTAIMLCQIDRADELDQLLEDRRINAVCLGPGLGLGAEAQMLVMSVLKQERGTVLDADALTQFEQNPGVLFEALHGNCVITPHGGEFARLFPDLDEKLNAPATTGPAYSKVDATREAAKRAGCVVLFKGPDTVIAAPNGCCSVNSAHYDRSAPWLATAGSGDVLAGFITGLMARGLSPMQAAETAAYLHVECALNFGPGLIAEDLPEQIPAVLRRLDIP
ncbi:NAD(P)H-hydrate dehydratase [Phaeobacter sp. HS012]|uniref:NAD(P)H-hydrate dehydratase n=1 Tax=unclassified Phaeobacter TaxID=2621772 RepID=UPI001B369F11|nr:MULTISPECIES: NAD(P)H-hydrate dehydratase [unclassified Phaeobacter]MBQ4807358.1 NAD(P)H-hydrate dehydratase [Phaeobacter sp. HS012]MBQ4881978.1 NAD(P)H-hydrate dehydratase [Phaeobacter sp. HS011]